MRHNVGVDEGREPVVKKAGAIFLAPAFFVFEKF
jgi:hypothetical protein